MKRFFLAVTLLALLVLGTRDLQAQAYGPYYYNPYWDVQYQQYQQYLQWQQYLAYLQQYDPYYELHVMHYQLYLPPYPSYQLYQPCCYAGGVIVPEPRPIMNPRLRAFTGPRSQAAVGPLPRATGPLPGRDRPGEGKEAQACSCSDRAREYGAPLQEPTSQAAEVSV